MKHAYLILAHNDVPLLRHLLDCLDDARNDIYVHWDLKSGDTPELTTSHSKLYLLEDRVAVSWGGFSMVEAEYLLFKQATRNGPYSYYHLLSGADLPIKTQDYIHAKCDEMAGTEFIAFADESQEEIDYRVQHYFLFSEEFHGSGLFKRALRKIVVLAQDLIGYHRTDVRIGKGSQWCSLTQGFVDYLLSKEAEVQALFNHTFSPDELFVQTVCINSPFSTKIKAAVSEYDGNMRYIKWVNRELIPINEADLPALEASDRWFARKFSSANESLISSVTRLSR